MESNWKTTFRKFVPNRKFANIKSNISSYRSQFELPNGLYMASHSVGCLPLSTRNMSTRFFSTWRDSGSMSWSSWLQGVDEFCTSIAILLNAKPEEICPQTNISSAVTKILHSLPKRRGKKVILLSELDFPSMGYALKGAEEKGYELRFIQAINNQFTLEQWDQMLTSDVQLAFITHALSDNCFLNPIAEISKIAQKRNIFTIVDVAQSAGIVPIDVHAWKVDFVVGCCVKWLCGGPGTGFLWVANDNVNQFTPTDVGWFSHIDPFCLDIHHFEYAKSAKRFWGGTPSILPYMVAKPGLDIINGIGLEPITNHNQKLLSRLIYGIHDLPQLTINSPIEHHKRGGTLAIQFADPDKAMDYFSARNLFVDRRPRLGFRISPHLYNTETEIDETIDIISKCQK